MNPKRATESYDVPSHSREQSAKVTIDLKPQDKASAAGAIITTDANELMSAVHDCMPVILHPGDFDRWLDRDSDPARPPIDLLRPFPADEMESFAVSKDVGNVKNNSPELLNSK